MYPVFLCRLSGKLIIVNVQSTVPQIDLFLNKFVHVHALEQLKTHCNTDIDILNMKIYLTYLYLLFRVIEGSDQT